MRHIGFNGKKREPSDGDVFLNIIGFNALLSLAIAGLLTMFIKDLQPMFVLIAGIIFIYLTGNFINKGGK